MGVSRQLERNNMNKGHKLCDGVREWEKHKEKKFNAGQNDKQAFDDNREKTKTEVVS